MHPTADLRDLRALIVDDNSTNRQILHKQLSSWRIENEGVENGSQALSALRSAAEAGEPYDLVILHMEMPEINGMQLARMIKGDSTISHIRLVLLTSAGRCGEGEEARQSGIEAYLPKPVKQSGLYDTLITIVSEPAETIPEEETQLVTRHTLCEWRAGTRARLLVVEDNPVNQRVAARTLEKLGYQVDVASNGREALEALSQSPYAAVLMDVQMPEMDGYEATAKIRRREEGEDVRNGRHTPIIAMTANAMQGDREKALDAGMDDYVAKPVKAEDLDAILKSWVSHEGEAPEPEASRTIPQDGSIQEDLENPLDEEVLSGLREIGDADLLAELVEVFFEDVPPRLAALREATESGDAESVERVAHTLKGSCGNMSAWRMAEICAELQETGVSGDLARAPDLLEQLEAEFGRVRPALEAEVARSQD